MLPASRLRFSIFLTAPVFECRCEAVETPLECETEPEGSAMFSMRHLVATGLIPLLLAQGPGPVRDVIQDPAAIHGKSDEGESDEVEHEVERPSPAERPKRIADDVETANDDFEIWVFGDRTLTSRRKRMELVLTAQIELTGDT
jgi:hypothetical protein